MKAINRSARRVLDKLTEGLAVGESRKVDNAPGVFMAVQGARVFQRTVDGVQK